MLLLVFAVSVYCLLGLLVLLSLHTALKHTSAPTPLLTCTLVHTHTQTAHLPKADAVGNLAPQPGQRHTPPRSSHSNLQSPTTNTHHGKSYLAHHCHHLPAQHSKHAQWQACTDTVVSMQACSPNCERRQHTQHQHTQQRHHLFH